MEKDIVIKGQATPAKLLALAIGRDAGVETLEKLMELQERHDANEARKAYHKAMAAFKAEPPTIVKNKVVDFKTQKGRTSYKHAGLAEAVTAIGKALSAQGLSAAWRTEQKDGGVAVTCEITHVLGHTEKTSLTAPPDVSGNKNSIQAIASTVTYLERYTLLALTGLAAQDTDDDGVGATEKPVIEEAEEAELALLIAETGTDMAKFCEYFKVESLSALHAVDYKRAVSQLEAKKSMKAGGDNG
jgi:hypothetical protein